MAVCNMLLVTVALFGRSQLYIIESLPVVLHVKFNARPSIIVLRAEYLNLRAKYLNKNIYNIYNMNGTIKYVMVKLFFNNFRFDYNTL